MKKGKNGIIIVVIVAVLLLVGSTFFIEKLIVNENLLTGPAVPTINLIPRGSSTSKLNVVNRPEATKEQVVAGRRTPGGTGSASHPVRSAAASKPAGIYQFAGHNSAANADKAYIQGTYLGYYWSQLEPQQGHYNWDIIDRDIKPWAANNKKIILRVATSGWARWAPELSSGYATPQWVYDAGVHSVTEIDQSVHPEYWNPKYLAAYQTFVASLAQHYDGSPTVTAVEIGIGDGGETKVDTRRDNPQLAQQWQDIGYSDSIWWDTIQKIIAIYTNNFHITPLVVLPDSSFIGKTNGYGEGTIVDYAISHGLWLQDDGLATGRSLQPSWLAAPHIEEQLTNTHQSGDSLRDDLQAALNLKASCVLIYADDINAPENASILQQMDPLFLLNT